MEEVKIEETPGKIQSNSETEHEIVFEDNKDEESNPNPEVDNKVDMNKPRVTRSGIVFGMQDFNWNYIEYQWFDESNAEFEQYKEESSEIISKPMCFYNDKLEDMIEETQLLLLKTTVWRRELKTRKKGKYASVKEMKQLHNRVVFEPISRNELNE